MAYRKKFPDSLVVKCNHCQSLYTYRRISHNPKTYYLSDDERVCTTTCFNPTLICRSLDGFAGSIRIFPDFIVLTTM